MSSASKEIISRESRYMLAFNAKFVDDERAKMEIVAECLRRFPIDQLVIAVFSGIDWTDRNSILPMLPMFGLIRRHARTTKLDFPRQLDRLLEKDGFRFNADWSLVRLKKDCPKNDDKSS